MKNILIIFYLISLLSCKKENGFNKSLYNETLKYQKKFSIPKELNKNLSKYFVYEISFYKKEKDTLMTMRLNPFGIRNEKSFGIYETEELMPTIVIDSANYGKSFIIQYKRDRLEEFKPINVSPIMDIIYPIYKYKLNKDKLELIDTIK